MVLPRLVDSHVHLDKAYTWQDHPNLSGSYGGASGCQPERAQQAYRGLRASARGEGHGEGVREWAAGHA